MNRFWIFDLGFTIKKHTTHPTPRFSLQPLAFSLLVVLCLLAACGGDTNAGPIPPKIHYGEDICEFCGMIVSEERFAAGYLTTDGEEVVFDDIGDMVQSYLKSNNNIAATFVHDYNDHSWIKAETAYYIQSQNLPTPMLSGIAAFTQQEQAMAFAAEQDGKVFKFEELLAEYQ